MQCFCGDPLCKAPVSANANSAWPVRCGACGTALYPSDVLETMPPDELGPKHAALMTEREGKRVPYRAEAQANDDKQVDRILAMVDTGGRDYGGGAYGKWLLVALVLLALALGAWLWAGRGS